MITKRGFLTGAASAAAVAASGTGTVAWSESVIRLPQRAAGPGSVQRPAIDLVVFNDRYRDARVFAQALGTRGVRMLPIAGDAGSLWYGVLAKQVAAGGKRVAGIGTSIDLLILESLAREAGLKVRLKAQHDCRGRRTLTHSIFGCARQDASALAAELADSDWPVRLAEGLASADTITRADTIPVAGEGGWVIATSIERSADHPGMLVSWVMTARRDAVSAGDST